MSRHSVFTRLTLFFTVVAAMISVGFYFLERDLEFQHTQRMEKEGERLLGLLRRAVLLDAQERQAFVDEHGYRYISDVAFGIPALDEAFETVPEHFPEQIRTAIEEGRIAFVGSNSELYLLLKRPDDAFGIGVQIEDSYGSWLRSGFGVLMAIIAMLYLSIIYSLLPLKRLSVAIRAYGENGTYLPTKSPGKDEIAYVANAFDEAVRKNRALLEARRLFMRNVMHELKTPITVGKLTLPFLPQQPETEMLERSFRRLEELIGDMAHVEQVTSGSTRCNLECCRTGDTVERATALMLTIDGEVVPSFDSDEYVYADCRMLSTVIKNLVDNALKYGSEKRIEILRMGDDLHFVNAGEPWPVEQTLEKLVQPFVYSDPDREERSFGLGLYIVKSLLEAQGFGFSHRFTEGAHHFIIENISAYDKQGCE